MRRYIGRDVSGIVLLDKPVDSTSNHALQRVKRLYEAAKAGHTGSLDPLATGMLPVCLGSATKVCTYLLEARKSYLVTACLGVATDSADAHGAVVGRSPAMELESEAVQRTLAGFLGEQEQIPPMYSALKYKGQRLYKLARKGIEVAREPRTIRLDSLQLRHFQWPDLEFEVTCSKGAYMRTLVEDVARALGTLGHVRALRRTAVEPFGDVQMLTLPGLEARARGGPAALDECLLPADRALTMWPRIIVPAALCGPFIHGRTVPAPADWPRGQVRIYSPEDEFLGIGEVSGPGQLAPRRVFARSENAVR